MQLSNAMKQHETLCTSLRTSRRLHGARDEFERIVCDTPVAEGGEEVTAVQHVMNDIG